MASKSLCASTPLTHTPCCSWNCHWGRCRSISCMDAFKPNRCSRDSRRHLVNVDDGTLVGRHLIVQAASGDVVVEGCPVDPGAALGTCLVIDPLDQVTANTLTENRLRREQILEVAHVIEPAGAGVVDDVYQANQLLTQDGYEGLDRVGLDKKTVPGLFGDGLVKCSCALPTVERVVAIPKGSPLCTVTRFDGANEQRGWVQANRPSSRYSINAFCACMRFSASSQTTLWGPSMTSAATSSPR